MTSQVLLCAEAKRAGCDLELKGWREDNRFARLSSLARDSRITIDELKTSAKRLFTTRMSLGEFDPPHTLPWYNISTDGEDSHRFLPAWETHLPGMSIPDVVVG